ncbi:MAG TPA: hypothetical protein EYG88_16065 [Desulfocapsa sulfexigens]|nr:hypothetical protein [Desulfocapsa sulfexigens]
MLRCGGPLLGWESPSRLSKYFDGVTAGIYMALFLEDHDPIFVVDVVNLDDAKPGSLYTFSADDARSGWFHADANVTPPAWES